MTDVERIDFALLRTLQQDVAGLQEDVRILRKMVLNLHSETRDLVMRDLVTVFERMPQRIREKTAQAEAKRLQKEERDRRRLELIRS
jgi:hypothetical protein